MKKLAIIGSLLAVVACTPAEQQKVQDVLAVIECKANVLAPYAAYFTSEQFFNALSGEDYFGILEAAGVTPREIQATGAALKACHD